MVHMDIEKLKKKLLTGTSEGYAVLLPLIEKDGGWSVLFEVRSPQIIQGGEVCFPGGRIEEDETAQTAAVRETCEELLISPEQIEILAPLPDHVHSPRFVSAYVGILHDYRGTHNEESERVFSIPLQELLKEGPIISEISYELHFPEDFPFELIPFGRNYPFRSRKEMVCFYKRPEALIWGMTANIMRIFLEILKENPDIL